MRAEQVKRTRGDTVEEISHVQFRSPPSPFKVSCRYCLKTIKSAQGRGIHEAAIHKVQRRVDGDCLGRQTRRREDVLRPRDGVGRGRCWVVRFSNTTEDGSSDSGPKSAAVFILKPIQYLRTNLKYDGFSPPQSQPNMARGAGKRRRYTFREKANVVEKLRSLEAWKKDIYRTEFISPLQYLAHESKIDTSLISKWASNEAEIVKEASGEVTKELFAKQSPRQWFPEAEQQLYDLFMARRKRKLKVSTLWVTVTYRKLLRDIYPDNPKAGAFHPSYRWAQRWANRHNLSKRRRSNLKKKSVEERLPQIRRFLRRFRKLMQEPARRKGHMVSDAEAGVRSVQPRDPKYGRFQLNERFNSDQVPLPFVNGQSETWAPKGSKRVSIAQPFSGLERRQCTIQPTIGPGGKVMQCAIIFRGTGKRISKVEKKAYVLRVDVFFQKNAWADSDSCMAWA